MWLELAVGNLVINLSETSMSSKLTGWHCAKAGRVVACSSFAEMPSLTAGCSENRLQNCRFDLQAKHHILSDTPV